MQFPVIRATWGSPWHGADNPERIGRLSWTNNAGVVGGFKTCGSSSTGRVSAFQAEGCGFEARLPLHLKMVHYENKKKNLCNLSSARNT